MSAASRRADIAPGPIDPRAFIAAKRDGAAHAPEELEAFIAAFARGEISDYQMSAWLMAAYLNGLDTPETGALTNALLRSGRMFDWTDLGRPCADKHSTGGVGDKISLILAPLVAACGVLVPMVSGRGLGHTGGTLDKLESIPGFTTQLPVDRIRQQLEQIGVVMVGQGPDIAPADGKLYALRDVTATVESEPFIVSSIVSKKVAEGAQAIVYDVKCGGGAFMQTRNEAAGLARKLIDTTRALGRDAVAYVTDMSRPLGEAAGNALEVREAVAVLKGEGPDDVRHLTLELAAAMLRLSGATHRKRESEKAVAIALDSGAAWAKFVALVEAQGGDASALERDDGLPQAPYVLDARARRAGVVRAIDTRTLGECVVAMGGGRRAKEDKVDPRVGVIIRRQLGDRVTVDDVLAHVHLAREDRAMAETVAACFTIGARAPEPPPLIIARLD